MALTRLEIDRLFSQNQLTRQTIQRFFDVMLPQFVEILSTRQAVLQILLLQINVRKTMYEQYLFLDPDVVKPSLAKDLGLNLDVCTVESLKIMAHQSGNGLLHVHNSVGTVHSNFPTEITRPIYAPLKEFLQVFYEKFGQHTYLLDKTN